MPELRDPPVVWAALRYSKAGTGRFTSARDMARLMERAIKRAQIPVAYTSGFSPHQRVSYAFPAPTGAASLAEYLLVGLTRADEPAVTQQALNAELPRGIVVESIEHTSDRHWLIGLAASEWRFDWPALGSDLWEADHLLADAVEAFMDSETVIIRRRAKSGFSDQDVRGAVTKLKATEEDQHPVVRAVTNQAEPLIRPRDVLAGLIALSPALAAWGAPMVTRLAQGYLDADGRVVNLGTLVSCTTRTDGS